MDQIPKHWLRVPLNELAKVQSGGTPSRGVAEYWDGDVPWVKISDIDGMYVYQTEEFITRTGLDNSSAKIFPKGTILLTIFATIGRVGILKIDAATNQAIAGITPSKDVDEKYFYFALVNFSYKLIEQGKGVAQKNINLSILKELQIPLPPLPEQKRIVAKLDTLFAHLDQLKTRLENIPTLLKQFRQAVLTQSVTGKLTEEWRKGKTVQDWHRSNIGNLFSVETGATPKRGTPKYYENASVPWIKSGLVKNEFIYEADEFITEAAVKETNAKIFPIDTLLVAMYGEGKTRGQIGWLKIEAATNQAIAALVNEEMPIVTKSYVYFFCLSQYNEIRAEAEGGNQPNLNLSKIKNWEIDIPPLEEQKEIVRRVESLFAMADKIEASYNTLKEKIDQLPQAILAKAFRGELK